MAVYFINLLIILGVGIPVCYYKPKKWKTAVYIGVSFLYMWLLATFRYGIGNDYYSYISIYNEIAAAPDFLAAMQLPYEKGFLLLSRIITYITQAPMVINGIYALLILAPVAYIIIRYSDAPWLSAFLYVCLTFYYASMNFIRQSLAASIIFLGYRFIKERKTLPVVLLVLLASSFHLTALIVLPIYFLAQIRMNKILLAVYSGVALVLYFTSDLILDFVTDYVYTDYKDSIYLTQGLSFVFLIVPVLTMAFCLIAYFRGNWGKQEKSAAMFTWFMFFNLLIWLFITKHLILERFSMYIYLFVIMIVPSILESMLSSGITETAAADKHRRKKQNRDVYAISAVSVVIVAFIYNIFGMQDGTNGFHGVFPYQTSIPIYNSMQYRFDSLGNRSRYLRQEEELLEYLYGIEDERYITVLAICKNSYAGIDDVILNRLHALGLDADFSQTDAYYLAVLEDNSKLHESMTETVEQTFTFDKTEISVSTTPEGWMQIVNEEGQGMQIKTGLMCMVFDSRLGSIVDAVSFDTSFPGIKGYHLEI